MFRLTKALINNVNQTTYLKNISKLKPKTIDTDTKDLVNDAKHDSLDEINRLETEVRAQNLKLFLNNYLGLRTYRFLTISLPAILTAGTIALFATPNRHDAMTNFTLTHGQQKIYSSEYGKTEIEKDYYVTTVGDDLLSRSVSANNEREIIESKSYLHDSLSFRIYDDVNSILAKFDIDSDGELTISHIKIGDYLDLNDYKDYNFENLDQDYYDLINRIINALNATNTLTDEQKTLLNNLNESDKKVIVAELIKYTELPDQDILISKPNTLWRIIFAIVTGLYLLIESMLIKEYKSEFFYIESEEIKNCNGELKKGEQFDYRLWFGPLRLKEEFIAAERDRIMRIKEEIDKNATSTVKNPAPILSRYERKMK